MATLIAFLMDIAATGAQALGRTVVAVRESFAAGTSRPNVRDRSPVAHHAGTGWFPTTVPIMVLATTACELPILPEDPALAEGPRTEIVTRADPVGITVTQVIDVRGKRIVHPNGDIECILAQTVVLAKGEAHMEWVSEHNPKTCEFTVKRGTKPGLAEEILALRDRDLAQAQARGDAQVADIEGTASVSTQTWFRDGCIPNDMQ